MPEAKTWPEVMTVDEAADYLRTNERTVRVMLKAGKLPGAKVGRAWRIRRADIDWYLLGETGKRAAQEA
jgi:excisionase family DNA binding protein